MNLYGVRVHMWLTLRKEVVVNMVVKSYSTHAAVLYCESVARCYNAEVLDIDTIHESNKLSNVLGSLFSSVRYLDLDVLWSREHDTPQYLEIMRERWDKPYSSHTQQAATKRIAR